MTRTEWMEDILARRYEQLPDNLHMHIERGFETMDTCGDVAIIYAWERYISDDTKLYYGLGYAKFFLWDGDRLAESHESWDYIRERFWELVW